MPIYNLPDEEPILIKKPSDEIDLTEEQAEEWIRCALDKYYFMENYVWVQSDAGRTLFSPRPYQKRIIELTETTRFNIIMSGRQSGKSQTLAVDLIHDMIFNEDYRIGFTSYTQTNTDDIRQRVGYIYENLPNWLKPAVLQYNQKQIKFSNNSSVQFQVTSETTFRGKSLNRIIIDELAHVETKVAEEFMTALIPSLTSGGISAKTRLTIISTPAGTSGSFAYYWFGAVNKSNGFGYTKVEYDEIPNRGEEFEKQMLGKMSKNKFDQEFRCEMISDKGTLVNSRVIEAIKTKEPVRIIGDLSIYVDSIQGRKLMLACDVSEGIGQDYQAFQVFDVDSLEQVAEFQNNMMNQTNYTKEIIRTICMFFNEGASEVYYTIENNGVGNGVLRLIENTNNPIFERATLISDENGKKTGLSTTRSVREKRCAQFKDLVEMNKLKIHSEALKTQMKFFVKQGATFKAEPGTHDDLVMSCIIMMGLMEILMNYEDSVYDVMTDIDGEDEVWDIIF